MPMEPGRPRPANNRTKPFMRLLLSVIENLSDLFNRVPIAVRGWHTQKFLDLAEVTDRFHLPTIQTQDESVLDRDDL
jgi:DNA-binding protein